MDIQPPDPAFLINSFISIQREIFVNICAHFTENVSEKNKNLYSRAVDFSKDFNDCEPFFFDRGLMLNQENFPVFCNYIFDLMNYVRKLDSSLFEESITHARTQMSFPTMPTLDMSVAGCGGSIASFLEMRENGTLPMNPFDSFDSNDSE